MSSVWVESLGYLATGVFVGSYFFVRPTSLRRMQMLGALLWVTYGFLISASPVVVANVLVFSAAAWTAWRRAAGPRNAAAHLKCQGNDEGAVVEESGG
jgi:hypothetical protein